MWRSLSSSRSNSIRILLLSCAVNLFLVWCRGQSVSPPARLTDPAHTITIGFIQSLASNGNPLDVSESAGEGRELLAAVQMAISDINSNKMADAGIKVIESYTLKLDTRTTYGSAVMAVQQTYDMLSTTAKPNPPLILGFQQDTEATAAGAASQPYQAPLLTASISAPSLTSSFPNILRYGLTDQSAAMATLTICNAFEWKNLAVIYNDDGSSATRLVYSLREYAITMAPNLTISYQSYTAAVKDSLGTDFPDITSTLADIRDSGTRIILLSSFSMDVRGVIRQANALGMIGSPYSWIGSHNWCDDSSLMSDPEIGPMLNGLICMMGRFDEEDEAYQRFHNSWSARYQADPTSTFNISQPTSSATAAAYDQVFAAAFALEAVLELKRQCNISLVGSDGYPFSGLIRPDLSAFAFDDYSRAALSSDRHLRFTVSQVPITAPDVCPWLLYQTGQGRVLNRILRNQLWTGVSGPVLMQGMGDRLIDAGIFNVFGGQRKLIGLITASGLADQLTISSLLDYPTRLSKPTIEYGNVSSAWRSSYDPATFTVTGAYYQADLPLDLRSGGRIAENIIENFTLLAIRWPDGTNTVPIDSPVTFHSIQGVSDGARFAIVVLSLLVMIFVLLLLAFQLRFRHEKLIKATSPVMNIVFLIGSLGVLTYTILLGLGSEELNYSIDQYVHLCHAKFPLLAVSFSLAFGSLFAKLYRLEVIFNSKKLKMKSVKDRDIILIVAIFVVIDAVILAVWGSVDPFYRHLSTDAPKVNPDNINEINIVGRESCDSNNFNTYIIIFLIYKGALLVFAVILSLRVRKIKIADLNDSKLIVLAIYNVALVSLLLIVVTFFVDDQPDAFYLIVGIGMIYLNAVVLVLLFMPRVMTLLFKVDVPGTGVAGGVATAPKGNPSSDITGGTDSSISLGDFQALKVENERHKAKLQLTQRELLELRRAALAAGVDLRPLSNGVTSMSAAPTKPTVAVGGLIQPVSPVVSDIGHTSESDREPIGGFTRLPNYPISHHRRKPSGPGQDTIASTSNASRKYTSFVQRMSSLKSNQVAGVSGGGIITVSSAPSDVATSMQPPPSSLPGTLISTSVEYAAEEKSSSSPPPTLASPTAATDSH